MNEQVVTLTGQVEVVKRLLRYVRREYTMKRNKQLEMIDNHQQGSVLNRMIGQTDAYANFITLYEKILKEYEEALEAAKKRAEEE